MALLRRVTFVTTKVTKIIFYRNQAEPENGSHFLEFYVQFFIKAVCTECPSERLYNKIAAFAPSTNRYFVWCESVFGTFIRFLRHLLSDSRFPLCLLFGRVLRSASNKHIGHTVFFYKSEALSAICTPATVCPYEVLLFCATERLFMRNSGFGRDEASVNYKLLWKLIISAESTKAVTEESIFRGKRALCLLWRSSVPK